jgi:hypothetical protein
VKQGLFRQAALEKMSSPERLDELMEVTTRQSWLTLLGLCTVIAAAALWAIFGSVPSVVRGDGVLIREGSLQTVDASGVGELRELVLKAGDDVRQDQVVARIVDPLDSRVTIVTSPYAGRVLEVRVTPGNQVTVGTALLSIEQPGRSLEAVLYLSPSDGKKVQPGVEVQIAPASVKKEEYGLLLGRVSAVGAFPATQAGLRRALGSDELARALSANGPPIEVHVELNRSAATASGYQWSSTLNTMSSMVLELLPDPLLDLVPTWGSAPGPPMVLASGTPCSADVITQEQAPIYLLLAKLNR